MVAIIFMQIVYVQRFNLAEVYLLVQLASTLHRFEYCPLMATGFGKIVSNNHFDNKDRQTLQAKIPIPFHYIQCKYIINIYCLYPV